MAAWHFLSHSYFTYMHVSVFMNRGQISLGTRDFAVTNTFGLHDCGIRGFLEAAICATERNEGVWLGACSLTIKTPARTDGTSYGRRAG